MGGGVAERCHTPYDKPYFVWFISIANNGCDIDDVYDTVLLQAEDGITYLYSPGSTSFPILLKPGAGIASLRDPTPTLLSDAGNRYW